MPRTHGRATYAGDRLWGRIINVSSVHGLVASPYKAAYVAAKHGVIGLMKTMTLFPARGPVTVSALCPGWVPHITGRSADSDARQSVGQNIGR